MHQVTDADISRALAPWLAGLTRRVSTVFAGGAACALLVVLALSPTQDLDVGSAVAVAVACVVGAVALRVIDLTAAFESGRRRWVVDLYPLAVVTAFTPVDPTPDERATLWVATLVVILVAGLIARPPALVGVLAVASIDVVLDSVVRGPGDWSVPVLFLIVFGPAAWFVTRIGTLHRRTTGQQLAERATSDRYARGVETVADLASRFEDSSPAAVVRASADLVTSLGWTRSWLHLHAHHRSTLGLDDEQAGIHLVVEPRPGGTFEAVLAANGPVVLDDYPEHPEHNEQHADLGLVIGVPITVGGDVVGALAVGRQQPGPSPVDVRLVELVAAQLSRALERARAFRLQRDTVEGAHEAALARDDFVATVSHELRTPIQVLLGMSELLDERWSLIDERQRRHFVSRMHHNATELAGLVDALMDLTRVDRSPEHEWTTVDLAAVVDVVTGRTVPVFDRHVVTSRLPAPGTVLVDGDPLLLDRVVDNLVTNACRHTPPGTSVTIAVERRGDEAVLTVDDDGPGIDAAELPRVRERFYRGGGHHLRRATRGLGLGLALCDAILAHHGGALELVSPPGLGLTATAHLPRAVGGRPVSGPRGRGGAVGADGGADAPAVAEQVDGLALRLDLERSSLDDPSPHR